MHLMVVLDDKLSDWEAKGELLRGYFNPDGIFSKITIVSLIHDAPSSHTVSLLAYPATAEHFSLEFDRLNIAIRTFGLNNALLKPLFAPLYKIIKDAQPDLVRCFGESLGTVAADFIKSEFNIPYIVSLHQTPAPDIVDRYASVKDRVWRKMMARHVNRALKTADGIIAVYSPILEYLPKSARAHATVIPNIVAPPAPLKTHPDPDISAAGFKVLWISRLIPGREPFPIIKAISKLENVSLTIIGSGPLRTETERLIETLGISDRVQIIPSMNNADLINKIPAYDVMALRTHYQEISKPIMEAGLAGLPVIINREPCAQLPEYEGLPITFVEDTELGYAEAIKKFQTSIDYRIEISNDFKNQAWLRWNPQTLGKRTAEFLIAAINAKGQTR